MPDSGQNWILFGYDVRDIGRHWQAAWRDLLLAYDSPIRQRLDEPVLLRSTDGDRCYHAGRPVANTLTDCSAVLLPDELVLAKTLTLPAAVESDLKAALALEVTAHSPFSAADTGYGWRVLGRDRAQLKICLVIVSMSSAMAWLGRQFDTHDPRRQEVWVEIEGEMVVVQGYGEDLRERRYRARLVRVAAMVGAIAILLMAFVGVATLYKNMELQHVQTLAATTQRNTDKASRMRESLAGANETIAAINRLVATYPNPHIELARLTHVLGDNVAVERLSVDGLEIELRGRAGDAAAVMQQLADESDYQEVIAPGAFTRLRGSELEQFSLTILKSDGGSQ